MSGVVTVSYLLHDDTLLKDATAILLQIVTKVYCKIRYIFYYKMRRLLQNASVQSILIIETPLI